MTVLFTWLLAGCTVARAQGEFALQDGDRVVFFGDSITDRQLYPTFVEDYVLTRFPRHHVRFVNSGWLGDRVIGGLGGPIDVRLARDVFAHRPTVVTMMLGMNDAGSQSFEPSLYASYQQGYEHIVDAVREALPEARLMLFQPSPFDDVTRPPEFEGGYNAVLVRYGQFVRELGERAGATVIDMNAPVVVAMEKAQALDPALARQIIPDRVHPGPAGHLVMAAALLKAWNAPGVVTSVAIDAPVRGLVSAENTRVRGIRGEDELSWKQVDAALPMPLDRADPAIAAVLRDTGVAEVFGRQTLRVLRLTAPSYTLSIDGEPVGRFTREELAGGIDLALLPTPMVQQAQSVHSLTVFRNQVHMGRWRQLQVPDEDHPSPEVEDQIRTLDQVEEAVVWLQHAIAQPVSRSYRLVPLSEVSESEAP